MATPAAAPPVAPNPKPVATPPPAPPSGMPAQVPQTAPQAQLSPARQAQREREVAREGALFHATAYEPRGSGVEPGVIVGGVGLLLAAGTGGVVVGWRRRVAQSARGWVRT